MVASGKKRKIRSEVEVCIAMSIRIKVNINQFGEFRVKTPEQSETSEKTSSMKDHDIVYESPNNTSSTEFELVYHADGHIYKVPSTTG